MTPRSHSATIPSSVEPPRRDGLALAIACVVVALAFSLEERPGGRLAMLGLEGLTLPNVCASRIVLGTTCPGCGVTRAIVRLAHGDWRGSWRIHRLGFPTALFILAQIPYRLVVMGRRMGPSFVRRLNRGQGAS